LSEKVKFQAIKGVRDILPPESELWNRVEQTAREVFATYGFGEIRLPNFELARLFEHGVGDETDIVTKELYVWVDSPVANRALRSVRAKEIENAYRTIHDDENVRAELIKQAEAGAFDNLNRANLICLRPEATASVVRAYIEHGMKTWPQPVKLYYMGPMFRRERPQKGRYRQFYQIGAEVLGQADVVAIDAEVIEMVMSFLDRVGLAGTTLYINSIGCKECRPRYVEILRQELRKVKDQLGPDSQRRIETNPLRVLDSKLSEEQPIIERLPRIVDYLCNACRESFAELHNDLKRRGIRYEVNWRLVRGLDYYVRTTFEITALGLGSQDAVCGGGRYDGLVEILGGPPTSGFGFAIGTDRLILALGDAAANRIQTHDEFLPNFSVALQRPDVVIAGTSKETWDQAILLAGSLRKRGLSVFLPKSGTKIPKVFEAAQRMGVRVAILLGETELREDRYTVRVINPLTPDLPRDLSVQASEITLYGKVVKLRQDLERAVLRLATGKSDMDTQRNLSDIVDRLTQIRLLTPKMNNAIKDLLPTLNRAIHGRTLTDGSVEWALAYGNLLLNELETLSPSER
jgi:histidyl-tRNA synthetase